MIKVLPLCGVRKLVFRPMRYLAILLTPMVILFSTPVFAEEITMICHNDGQTRTHRYVNPLLGFKKVLIRREGNWENWGNSDGKHVPPKLRITDRGAVLETVTEEVAAEPIPKYGLAKGDPVLTHRRYVLDFEFFERTVHWYHTYRSGPPLEVGREGHDPDKPYIAHWSCKKS
jgi:hypothetical protein